MPSHQARGFYHCDALRYLRKLLGSDLLLTDVEVAVRLPAALVHIGAVRAVSDFFRVPPGNCLLWRHGEPRGTKRLLHQERTTSPRLWRQSHQQHRLRQLNQVKPNMKTVTAWPIVSARIYRQLRNLRRVLLLTEAQVLRVRRRNTYCDSIPLFDPADDPLFNGERDDENQNFYEVSLVAEKRVFNIPFQVNKIASRRCIDSRRRTNLF